MKTKLRLGVIILVLGGFTGVCFWQVLARKAKVVANPDQVTIRIAHWLLQSGVRESFDEAAADYHTLHPNVTVEQVAVPIRIWPSWLRTQLVGGTAPDLVGLRNAKQDTISRYFLPLTRYIEEPNPYNAGTPLEGVPWRHTFIDGLDSMRALMPSTGEVPGVMLLLNTTRLFYNRTLLKKITGSDAPPADYAGLRALGEKIEDYNHRTGSRLVPIAGCGPYADYMFASLLPALTQKLTIELSPMQTLSMKTDDVATQFVRGKLSYRTPEMRASLSLLRDVSALLTPGYLQMQRDDALFSFLQGNAVMIYAGSWDYTVFARNEEFEVGITPMPFPSKNDPDYGRFVLGPSAESNSGADATFGITRNSPHPEIALDFLRFLTSQAVARKLAATTYRNSAIVGVELPAHARGLTALTEGAIPGFRPDFSAGFGGGNAAGVFQKNLYLLFGAQGSVDAFVDAIETDLPGALRQDLRRRGVTDRRSVQELDTRLVMLLTQPAVALGVESSAVGVEPAGQVGQESVNAAWVRTAETQHEIHGDYLRMQQVVGK